MSIGFFCFFGKSFIFDLSQLLVYNYINFICGVYLMGATEKIRIILIKRNMKIKELAEKLGYSGNNMSNKLKNDNFSEKELFKIAEILNCSYDSVFTFSDTGETI